MGKFLKWLSFGIMFIGAFNWGLIGLFNFDLVAFLFGNMSIWSRIIYTLVGLAALTYGSMVYLTTKMETDY